MLLYLGTIAMLTLNLQTPSTQPTPPATGFLLRTLTMDGETYVYSIYVPLEYTPERPWPVILFLHGAGERGSDGLLQTQVGIGTAIRHHRDWFPAIVVLPQCRPQQTWTGTMAKLALRCVEETSRDYRCDPQRLYLTGLSLGGHGTWHIAAELPERFAALVPVCGFVEWEKDTGVADKIAARLAKTPIWCFHGDADKAVPVARTREVVAALRKAGSSVKYSELPGVEHNAWDPAYMQAGLWEWLFAQERR